MAASELLMTNGATPATPSSGKSKLFFNTAKVLSYVNDSGTAVAVAAQGAVAQSSPTDPTGTASATATMMGLAGSITPQSSGRVQFTISGDIANSASGDGTNVQLYYGTGTAPANAAALTGNAIGSIVKFVAAAAAQRVPFSITVIVSGLAIGTAYWIDASLAIVTGGTGTIKDISLAAIEI